MSQDKFSTHGSNRKSLLWQLVKLITVFVLAFSGSLQMALAGPIEWPPPPEDPPLVDPDPPGFVPYPGGFDWAVPSRFGRDDNHDGIIDYHYNSTQFQYDKNWLYPDSWSMIFDGCRTEADAAAGASSTNIYTWTLNGETIEGNRCRFTYGKDSPNPGNLGFPDQGTYGVDLVVTYPDDTTETFHQDVVVRDILIVSLGDSYASGEGIPDLRQRWHLGWPIPIMIKDADPVWQDQRCHRSAKGGPPLAALAIERMDPKTSVTFISYACSGATIGTELFDGDGFRDPSRSRGTGVLGPYIGQEPPSNFKYYAEAGNWNSYIPSQMGQLKNVLIPPSGISQRQIGALIVSGGGNDTYFGDWMAACLLFDNCWDFASIEERPGDPLQSPRNIVDRALGIVSGRESNSVPKNYELLANELATINPAPLNVYLTQYPDGTTGNDGGYCRMLDDILWPNPLFAITPEEASNISTHALKKLNETIFQVAKQRGWVYVDGLANYIQSPDDPNGPAGLFYKHGYCATENWIVRADESELAQGPLYFRFATKGTAHPNYSGTLAISKRLVNYMIPNLFPQPPANPPTINEPVYRINNLVSEAGASGWYVRSCQDGACYPKAVMQIIGTAEAGVDGAGVTIDGVDACTVNGVTCRSDGGLSSDKKQYVWNIEISADGIYDLQFNLRDKAGAVAFGGAAIKVDLHDPVLAAPGPFTVDEGGKVALKASVAYYDEGSPVSFTWDLDNNGDFETYDQEPEFSAASLDGPTSQTIKVKATDQAGRSATSEAVIEVVNVAPAVEISGIPESNPEGTAIDLNSSVTDPGVNDTFTYEWTVKKNGIDYGTTGTNTSFSFTPDDNGSYVVSLKVTDDDGGVGSTSQTIDVTNVAPTMSNISVTPGTVNEGGSVTVSGNISDPGSADSFELTVTWGDGSAASTTSLPAGSTSFSLTHTYADDNPTGTPSDTNNISLSVKDKDGGIGTGSASVVVNNLAPSLTITAPADGALYALNTSISLSGAFSDAGTLDTFSCSVDWGDGVTAAGTLTAGGCSASHAYGAAGVYNVKMTVNDDDTGSEVKTVMVVVYDPSAGFVTGGGWIDSPAGAYKPDESLSGKATFGFVSKYQKGASVPTGNTEFQFHAGGFKFHSTAYEWLVVNTSGTNAQFKGSGLINGAPDPNGSAYKFMLWATDGATSGGPDTFRIRIWWEDATGEHDIYDNGVAQALGGGSIVVHTKK
jgi:hypothetical protein